MFDRARWTTTTISMLLTAVLHSPLHAEEAGLIKTAKGDIAFELIGQVLNVPMTPVSD